MADQKISQLTGATTPLAGSEVLPIVQSGTTKKVSVANLTAGRAISASQAAINSSAAPVSKLDVWGTSAVATSQATYVGSIQLNENPTSLSEAGGVEWKAADFGAGYGWKAVTVDSSGVHLILANRQNSASWTEFYRFSQNGNFTISTGNLIQGTAAKGVNFTANTPAAGMTSQLLNWYEEGTWTPAYTTTGTDFTSVTYSQQVGRYTRIGRMVYIYIRILTTGFTGGSGSLQIKNLPFTANSNTDDATVPVTFAFGWASNPAVVAGIVGNTTKMTLYYSLVNQECPYNAIDASGNSYLRMAGCYEAA